MLFWLRQAGILASGGGALWWYWSGRAVFESSSIWDASLVVSCCEWCGVAVGKAWHTAACAKTVCGCTGMLSVVHIYVCVLVPVHVYVPACWAATCTCLHVVLVHILRPGAACVGVVWWGLCLNNQKEGGSGLHAWDWFSLLLLASIHYQACRPIMRNVRVVGGAVFVVFCVESLYRVE